MSDPKSGAQFDQALLDLFDQYVHGAIDRRGFLDRAGPLRRGRHDGGHVARRPEPALRRGPADPPRRQAPQDREWSIESPEGSGKMKGYLARAGQAAKASCPRCWWCTRTGG